MPSPLAYSRKHRLILQVVMVLLLGGTLGLAALIRHMRVGPSGVPLSEAIGQGQLKMRLPDWDLKDAKSLRIIDGADPHQTSVLAIERGADSTPTGRILEVMQQDVDPKLSAEEYLVRLLSLPPGTPSEAIRIVGTRGIFLQIGPAPAATRAGTDAGESQVVACAVLPTHLAVTVRLRVAGRAINPSDVALVRQVAKTLQLRNLDQGTVAGG